MFFVECFCLQYIILDDAIISFHLEKNNASFKKKHYVFIATVSVNFA